MSETLRLGQSIIQAMKFLRGVHKDVYELVTSLDAAMAEKNWYPARKNRVSSELSNALSFEGWLISGIWRLYVPNATASKTTTVAGILVDFEPAEVYDEPICLLAVARFSSAMPGTDIWDEWCFPEEFLADKHDFEKLTPEDLKEMFPKLPAVPRSCEGS